MSEFQEVVEAVWFIKHPRTKQGSPSITFATWTLVVVLIKTLLSGVVVAGITFGMIDAGVIAALLTPTLGALVVSKYTDVRHGAGDQVSKAPE